MRFGSLFSGIGGFDLGFEQAGLESAWQVELDADCNRVLEKHWPGVIKHKDVRSVGQLESVDVICGGFPCQDLSVAGKRAGLAGERSGLWFEFLRIVGLNRPRWVVVENVPGLLSSDESRDFAAVLRGLVECGYCIAWRVLDAQFYGVAQRRRRVFVVGSLGDGSSAEILFESESVSWNPPTRREAGARVAPSVACGPPFSRTGNERVEAEALIIPIQEVGARESKNQNGVGIGIGKDSDVMYTLQSGQVHGVATTSIYHENIDGKVYESSESPALRNFQKDAPMVVTHALRSEGADASEDGTGRGTPLVVDHLEHHRFHCLTCGRWFGVNDYESNTVTCPTCDETHINKITDVLDGPDIAATLNSGGNNGGFRSEPGEHLIAFSSKDHGADAGEIAPTLRSQNFKDSHMNGGGQVAIAFGWNKSDSQTMRVDEATTDALQSSPQSNPAIAFSAGQGSRARSLAESLEHTPPLKAADSGLNRVPSISNGFGVRRLTPRECERLQGFPDDFTRYDASGKEISDSARYRMLGNAVCVNVARWIGKRILETAKVVTYEF